MTITPKQIEDLEQAAKAADTTEPGKWFSQEQAMLFIPKCDYAKYIALASPTIHLALIEQNGKLREALEKIATYTKPTGMHGGSIVNEIANRALSITIEEPK